MSTLLSTHATSHHDDVCSATPSGTDCDMSSRSLVLDEALLEIDSRLDSSPLTLLTQSAACRQCALQPVKHLGPSANATLIVDTKFLTHVAIEIGETRACEFDEHFGEAGRYRLTIEASKSKAAAECTLDVLDEPHDANIPLFCAVAVFALLALLWFVTDRYWLRLCSLYERCRYGFTTVEEHAITGEQSSENQSGPTGGGVSASTDSNPTAMAPQVRKRIHSLDTFRGFCILLMIFVNSGGGGYYFLRHSIWDGLTAADLVFPWFLFIMGVAMVYAFRFMRRRQMPRRWMLYRVLRRSALLILLGFTVNTSESRDEWSDMRFSSVLARFGTSYLFVGLMEIHWSRYAPDSASADHSAPNDGGYFPDLLPYGLQWLIVIGVAAVHTGLTLLLPLPDGCPTGYLGPGGLAERGRYANCTGGAAGYVDRLILGAVHLYDNPTCKEIYKTTVNYDPEGLLGHLTGGVLVMLGLQAGRVLVWHSASRSRLLRFVVWSVLLGLAAIALVLAGVPINKNLWSLSYVFATASLAYALFALFYFLIDELHWWSGAPFFYPAVNAIVLYVGSEVLSRAIPFYWHVEKTHRSQLFIACWTTFMWFVVSCYLYREKIFIAL